MISFRRTAVDLINLQASKRHHRRVGMVQNPEGMSINHIWLRVERFSPKFIVRGRRMYGMVRYGLEEFAKQFNWN